MYVVESAGDDPMGPYTFKARLITDPKDEFYAIDGTVLTMPDDRRYFVWCGRPSPAGQGLYISRMANPWTLEGPRVYLEADGFGCEHVREGPVALRQDGSDRTFLVYSACGADTPDYKLGMLSISAGADPMAPASWKQHRSPVFTRNDDAGVYGPGHSSFFRSPDGREYWISYHAKTLTTRGYGDRSARAQKFTWNADGTPDFGRPVGTDVDVAPPSGEPGVETKPGR
jgi:GH43 family beta-xylosidase